MICKINFTKNQFMWYNKDMSKVTFSADVLNQTFTIHPKKCTGVTWPLNADLFITHLPSSEKDGYSTGLVSFIANRAYFSLHNNALAFVIISSFKEEKDRPYKVIDIFASAGFKFVDSIIWLKNKCSSIPGSKRLNNVYDFVFMFAKGNNYHLNRGAVSHLKNRLDTDNENEYLCPGNVWKIKVDDVNYIPTELVENLINVSNLIPNSLIIDPFMSSGVTLKTALDMGHSYWGTESDAKKYNQCKSIVKKFQDEQKK